MREDEQAQAVAYLRAASKDQSSEHNNLEVQRQICEAMARRLGVRISDSYIDIGVSGLRAERPGLTRLMRDLSRGGIRYVFTADPARLARSRQLAQSLKRRITQSGASLIDDCERVLGSRIRPRP